jgi:hypothetical protein
MMYVEQTHCQYESATTVGHVIEDNGASVCVVHGQRVLHLDIRTWYAYCMPGPGPGLHHLQNRTAVGEIEHMVNVA